MRSAESEFNESEPRLKFKAQLKFFKFYLRKLFMNRVSKRTKLVTFIIKLLMNLSGLILI